MKKKFLAVVLCVAAVFLSAITAKDAVSPIDRPEVFLKQEKNTTCTLCAAAMMLRRRAILAEQSDWQSITETNVGETAWAEGAGLKWNFVYGEFEVNRGTLPTGDDNAEFLIELLNAHPEGIVIYRSGKNPHAVLLTDYTDGEFICADPYKLKPDGRIPLSKALYVTAENVNAYWCIVN